MMEETRGVVVVGYCVDCKHWKKPRNVMGICLKTIEGWESSVGTMDEEWEGGLYTGPLYGCVHFRKAEE